MDLVFLFGSRRFSQLSVSSFAQPISFHSNGYRHTVVNELSLCSRIPNENSDEHGLGQEDGLATSRRDTALIAAICARLLKVLLENGQKIASKLQKTKCFPGRQYGIFYPQEEELSKVYFHFPSRESGSSFEL